VISLYIRVRYNVKNIIIIIIITVYDLVNPVIYNFTLFGGATIFPVPFEGFTYVYI